MQPGTFRVVEVVPIAGDLERNHRALGQVGGLVELESAVFDAGFQRGHAVRVAPLEPLRRDKGAPALDLQRPHPRVAPTSDLTWVRVQPASLLPTQDDRGAAWDHEKPSVVELRTEQAVVEEIAYATGNSSAAFAVRRAAQWPGLVVLPQQLGRISWTARRPDFYFDQDSPQWPETATLQLTMPPLTLTDATVRDAVSQELERIETEAHDALLAKGGQVLGPQKVLAMSPYDRATSWEALRSRNPTFAVGRGQRDAFFEAVRVLREFRKTYRSALIAWRAGLRAALFPVGTWFMRWGHSATVAPS